MTALLGVCIGAGIVGMFRYDRRRHQRLAAIEASRRRHPSLSHVRLVAPVPPPFDWSSDDELGA